ncbi:MAG TPA: TAT-variant-translocated molybdopterin oxidoreductase [Tepidisphaeraceae bacterium]|nr:TAT-variant-translocated molybdopterin oxidoreductase [Tepidisphaeraceae bacterium]
MEPNAVDLADIRRRLQARRGPSFWRSLEELAATRGFREAVDREFPAWASRWDDLNDVSRRKLLKIMGASLGLLGLSGCFYKRPQQETVPYTNQPEEIVAGRPVFFATAMPFCGFGKGVLALSREGRPIKIEGNPDHPASLGGTDLFMQASVLDLYDPDRSPGVLLAGEPARWGEFQREISQRLEGRRRDGSGVRILTGTITSPLFQSQMDEFLKRYPGAAWHEYEPMREGLANPFAEPVEAIYDLRQAGVIASFGADFMFRDPGSVQYARHFANGRRVREESKKMSRLYMVESSLSLTGSMADHRLALPPSRMEAVAGALAHKLGVALPRAGEISPQTQHWVDVLAQDLTHPPQGTAALVAAGANQPAAVQAIVHLINQKLGTVGKTVAYIDPIAPRQTQSLDGLAADALNGKVDTLLMIGVNPVYNGPADVAIAEAINAITQRGQFTAAMASHYDETSFLCRWHIPAAHYLESWGDVSAFDGTASVIQPLIAPLHESYSQWELMETLLARPDRDGLQIVREFWQKRTGAGDFEQWWIESLQKGVIAGTAAAHRAAPAVRGDVFDSPSAAKTGGIEILFEPDFSAWDGQFANNAWLQEIPRPFTKLTWDNAIAINLRMAEKLAPADQKMLQDGDMVRVEYAGRQIEAPVILLPGQADDVVTLYLGYGRSRGGQVMLEDDKPRGYSAYALRTSGAAWAGRDVRVSPTGQFHFLVVTRNHHAMSIHPGVPGVASWLKPDVIARPGDSESNLEVDNRKIIRLATLQQFQSDSDVIKHLDPEEEKKPLLSLYPGWDYQHGLQWGMSIDMTACMGCNACIVACQAENNIAVVGKDEVSRQREMHWIRIDDYYAGDLDSPTIVHQPVPCMQCENAPCEYVCPVGATTHSDEGINEMTYNRCIGTRYCSNNCPYKVRRFNFFLFSDYQTPTLKLLHNPDVTVRSRGVMEKCTYCIQRIDRTRIEMEEQVLDLQEQARGAADPTERDRLMRQASELGVWIVRRLQTACQQACPTRAIQFGDIRDKGSEVARLKLEPTNYTLLSSLTTKPRTSYLARLTNPNPELEKEGPA